MTTNNQRYIPGCEDVLDTLAITEPDVKPIYVPFQYEVDERYDVVQTIPDKISLNTLRVAIARMWRNSILPFDYHGRRVVGLRVPLTWFRRYDLAGDSEIDEPIVTIESGVIYTELEPK
ncbi:MAG TPA: hypothetical protein EYN66_07835 [Myxococcales bacterium]|nr:hypothetical protein [Myxococcales bacterium]